MSQGTKKASDIKPGTYLMPTEPDQIDTCEWELQQKAGGKWTHGACGEKAHVTVAFWNGGAEKSRLVLCRACLARFTHKLVTLLE